MESLSSIAFKAVLDVVNEALAAGDLVGGTHALMNLVGGVYFGGGDVGHAIWIAHGLEEQIWGELIRVCQTRWRTIEPSPNPRPRLPWDIIEAIGPFCGLRSTRMANCPQTFGLIGSGPLYEKD